MARLQLIIGAGYTVDAVWEYQFDKDNLPRHPKLKYHPLVQHAHLNSLDVLYWVRTEIMVVHYATLWDDTVLRCYESVSLSMQVPRVPRRSP